MASRNVQVKTLEGHRVVEGSCGGTHTMVVTDEGRCFIWGRGAFGRCVGGYARISSSLICCNAARVHPIAILNAPITLHAHAGWARAHRRTAFRRWSSNCRAAPSAGA